MPARLYQNAELPMKSAKSMFAEIPSPRLISADLVFRISEKADRLSRQLREIATTMGNGWRGLHAPARYANHATAILKDSLEFIPVGSLSSSPLKCSKLPLDYLFSKHHHLRPDQLWN